MALADRPFSTVDDKYPPIVRSYSIPPRPPTPPPAPSVASVEYWRGVVSKQRLPPIFQLRFPFNAILMLMLPVLLPFGLSYAYFRVSSDAKSSRRRLKQLEKDESFQERLVNVLKRVDKEVENAIVDLIEEGQEQEDPQTSSSHPHRPTVTVQPSTDNSSSPSLASMSTESVTREEKKKVCGKNKPEGQDGSPIFSLMQLKIIDQLSALPFHKYSAIFPGVFSSHAVIVARDVNRFAFHERGRPILQHWADHFIL